MRAQWLLRLTTTDVDVDGEHGAVVVRTLSAARLVLALLAAIAFAVDPPELTRRLTAFLVPVLTGFLIYSLVLMVVAYVRPRAVLTAGLLLHGVDLAWVVLLITTSEGANSPFMVLFVYAILAGGYRWGLTVALGTAAFAIAMLGADAYIGQSWQISGHVHLNSTVVRATYFTVAAVLIGLLADEERRARLRARAVAGIMDRVRTESGMVASVRAVFDDLFAYAGASRGLLILHEDEADLASLWHARRSSPDARLEVRLKQDKLESCPAFMFPLPAIIDAVRIRRQEAAAPAIAALDRYGVRCPAQSASAAPLLNAPFEWSTALCVAHVAGRGWSGRLFVFDPRRGDDHALRFLQVVIRQVAPALFNLYLQRRLQSRGGAVDRMRVSQELHDGVIQSLIGLDMELEVLRRNVEPSVPAAVRHDLATIQGVLGQEILAVRDLMQSLRPVAIDPDRLPEHVAAMLDEFRRRTGVDARLSSTLDEADLPRRTCNEIVRVLQEALANVRKHSGASNVLVQFSSRNNHFELAIDDDGKGFDFAGRLTEEELEARGRCPVVLRDRIRAMGGRLAIVSRPGHGTRLEITIPR